jgi:Cof subfamily protein (haloacid dehalogenase superfamily)
MRGMRNLKYKLVCLDMDGTLLDDEKKISNGNKMAIRKATELGIKVIVCTGRLFIAAQAFADMIGVSTPLITANGASVKEKETGNVIFKAILGKENCLKIVRVMKKYNINPNFNTTDTVITDKIGYSSQSYINMNKTLPADKQVKIEIISDWDSAIEKYGDDILKCISIDADIEKMGKVKEELINFDTMEIQSSLWNNIEMMNKGINKGKAVKMLAEYYGIDRKEIICMGDNENDISMIEYAGMGIAMGNAEKKVKSISNFVTETNNNDGVARAIESIILNG